MGIYKKIKSQECLILGNNSYNNTFPEHAGVMLFNLFILAYT